MLLKDVLIVLSLELRFHHLRHIVFESIQTGNSTLNDVTDPGPPAEHNVTMLAEFHSNTEVPVDDNSTELQPQSVESLESVDRSTNMTEQVSMLQVQKSSALFLLSCKERFRLPQTAINFAIGAVNAIVNDVCDLAKQSIEHALSTNTSTFLAIEQC